MAQSLEVASGDVQAFEAWIATELRAVRQSDWEDDTVDDLTEYISLVVRRAKSTSELRTQCAGPLNDFLGTMTQAFIDQLVNALRVKAYLPKPSILRPGIKPQVPHQPAAQLPNQESRSTVRYGDGFHPAYRSSHMTQTQSTVRSSHKTSAKLARHKKARHGRNGRSRSPLREQDAYSQPRHHSSAEQYGFIPLQQDHTAPSAEQPFYGNDGGRQRPQPAVDTANFAMSALSNPYAFPFGGLMPNVNTPNPDFGAYPSLPLGNGDGNQGLQAHQLPCINLYTFGFCLVGSKCIFSHDRNLLMPDAVAPAVQQLNPEAANYPAGKGKPSKGAPGTSSILVMRIPPECLEEDIIRDQFEKSGSLKSVALDVVNQTAVVTFVNNNSANNAVHSSEPMFNNRFVSVRYFRGSVIEGRIIYDDDEKPKKGGYHMTIEQASLDNRDPEQAAQEAEQLRAHRARQLEYEHQKYVHETNVYSLKKQLHDKGRMLEARKPADSQNIYTTDLRRRKMILETELTSIETGQASNGGTAYRSVNQIDHRPRQFRIHVLDPEEYKEVTEAINRFLSVQKAQPTLVGSVDEPPDPQMGTKATSGLIIGYSVHSRAQRMFDTIATRLEGKVKLVWLNNTDEEMGNGDNSMAHDLRSRPQSDMEGEAEQYLDLDVPQDLDVAEDEDWAY